MKNYFLMVVLILFLSILTACSAEPKRSNEENKDGERIEIRIAAAASLTDALEEFKEIYEKEHDEISISFMYGGSGKLTTSILNGAPIDVFLSASSLDMDRLQRDNAILSETRLDFAENQLALITNHKQKENNNFKNLDFKKVNHLIIGEPDTVPAGRYAKEVLTKLEVWNQLKGKLVFGSDVRQVLTQIELGNADYGIVYASDASISKKVQIIDVAEEDWHSPIVYPGAVIEGSKHPREAKKFLEALNGEAGQKVLSKYGFK